MLPWTLSVALAAPPSVDEPLRTGASAPADAALVIGVEDYAFVPDVPYARRDAEAVRQWLVYTRGVPAQNVEALTDASREQILAAVDRAVSKTGPDGTLWLYWAGHGAAAPEDGRRLLLGVDVMADETVFAARAVGVDEIRDKLRGTESVLWLDTCYSGSTRGGAPLLPGTRFAVPAWATRPDAGTWVWTAADAGQLSSSWDPAQHGLFTYFSVGALRGWADGELDGRRDGAVTAAEAQAYVTRALSTLGEHKQTPVVEGGDDSAVLAIDATEEGPELASLTTAAPMPQPAAGTDLGLDELRAAQDARRQAEADAAAEREAAIEAAIKPLRQEARRTFKDVEEILAGGGEEGELALRRYLEVYEGASVEVDGETIPVDLPVVGRARSALRDYDSARDTRRALAAKRRQGVGLLVGIGAVSALSVAAGTKAAYTNADPTAGELSGLYVTNQVTTWTGVGLAAVSGGLVFSGVFR